MNCLPNTSRLNLDLNLPAPESSEYHDSTLSDLQPISATSDLAAFTHRANTSTATDPRRPSTTSDYVQRSGEHNSTALTQGHLEPSEPKQKFIPVPPEYWHDNEDEHTRISLEALRQRKYNRKLVPIPPKFRLNNEDEHTRISPCALRQRKRRNKRVSVPPEYWRGNENEHTQISPVALLKRMRSRDLIPVPPEYWRGNENEHTRISSNALALRKYKKLKSAALSRENPHAPH
jgi:hypothetical protein